MTLYDQLKVMDGFPKKENIDDIPVYAFTGHHQDLWISATNRKHQQFIEFLSKVEVSEGKVLDIITDCENVVPFKKQILASQLVNSNILEEKDE